MDQIELYRTRHVDCINKAQRLHRRISSRKTQLRAVALWTKISSWRRFVRLHNRLKDLEWQRFAYVSVALNLARSISRLERRRKCLNSTTPASS